MSHACLDSPAPRRIADAVRSKIEKFNVHLFVLGECQEFIKYLSHKTFWFLSFSFLFLYREFNPIEIYFWSKEKPQKQYLKLNFVTL